jgi:hypothetical protein
MRCDDTVSASSLHRGRIVNHKENNNQQKKYNNNMKEKMELYFIQSIRSSE